MSDQSLCFFDFKELMDSNFHLVFSSLEKMIISSAESVPVLFNLEDFFISNSFKKALTDFIENNKDKISAIVIYGVEKGVKKLILNSMGSFIYFAESREDAEDWLQSL